MSTYLRTIKLIYKIGLILSISLQASCVDKKRVIMELPQTLPDPVRTMATKKMPAYRKKSPQAKQIKKLQPRPLVRQKQVESEQSRDFDLPTGKLTLNADSLPLKDFIHLALNEVLQIPFEMDDKIAKNITPVNLHISKPLPAEQLFEVVEQLLNNLDVSLVPIKHGLRVLPKKDLKNAPPMISGASNKMGTGHIVEVIPLQYVKMNELKTLSASLFQMGKYGRVDFNKRLNSIVAVGEPARVQRLKEFVEFLDYPSFKQHHLRLVRPIYWSAKELASQLINLLKVQGIPTSDNADDNASVIVLTIESMNAVLVTSPQKEWMQQAEYFISELDNADAAGPDIHTFIYFTKHRPADELGSLILQTTGKQADTATDEAAPSGEAGANQQKTPPEPSLSNNSATQHNIENLNVITDKKRNALIFIGTAKSYQMIVPILKALDIPARQVLIELTVADVTLNELNKIGIQWQFDQFNIASAIGSAVVSNAALGLTGMGGASSGGLTYAFLDEAIGIRALLNALTTRSQAKILSSPTLLAMDGEKAHFQVGSQISVINNETSNSASSTGNGTGLLRSFTYIDTGVILDITPIITEHGSVRMEIRQEVSTPGTRDPNGQPAIDKREIETILVAESGQTILMGGLIRHNTSDTQGQIPLLGDIPYLGALFRDTSQSDNSTELIIVITPHIIKNQNDANELTQSYRKKLGW